MSQYHINDNTNSFNHTSIGVVNNFTVVDNRAEILEWISPLKPKIRHQDIRTRRVKDVGGWVLQTDEYRSWYDGRRYGGQFGSAVLFCCGGPGVGKTYISSLVIDSLCDRARGQNVAVACFYFDYADRKEQTPSRVLRALLNQIIAGLEVIPEVIKETFRDQKRVLGGRELSHSETLDMLQTISSAQPTFICLDALDECMVERRLELLVSLRQVLQNSPGTRIFLTGRPNIQPEIKKHLSGRALIVPIKPNEDDIVRFLDTALEKDTVSDAMDSSLREEILKSIPERISETFLLVSLNIEAILQGPTIHRRREKLKAMKNGFGLEDAYGATLERIKAQGGEMERIGIAALTWIFHSQRPLRASELCHALAVEVGSRILNTEDIPSVSTVLSYCQGLVAIDQDVSTVRLIHRTLQEYLSSRHDLFGNAHSKMAETTLTYLNLKFVTDLPVDHVPDPKVTPLLEYSSLYWGTHARIELSDCAKSLALKLLDHYDSHVSGGLLFNMLLKEHIPFSAPSRRGFTALHYISFFGIIDVAIALTKMKKWDRDQRDILGMTPLLWAAKYGHEEIVRLLVKKGLAEPDCPDTTRGLTALCWAARNGHKGLVRFFLGRDFVNPNYPNRLRSGVRGAVGLLLGKKHVDPNRPDTKFGRTPLSWAAEYGWTEVVELLLACKDVDPDRPDNSVQTPLSWAAANGRTEAVELLLAREDIDPDRPDKFGQTPLSWAAANGRIEVVELLLACKVVDPDRPDNSVQTPLSWAAENGQAKVVEILLAREDIDHDRPDNDGRTPLSRAAENGQTKAVALLLAREDIDHDRPDNDGRTPLSRAASRAARKWQKGHTEVVELLLARKGVDPDRPDSDGRTPLSWAVRDGHTEAVELLLARKGVDPDRPDNGGRTPLSWASAGWRKKVVEILLARKGVDPDRPDNDGRTPFSWAGGAGDIEAVELLLACKGVDPDRPDNGGRTPLSWASPGCRRKVVELLRARNAATARTP